MSNFDTVIAEIDSRDAYWARRHFPNIVARLITAGERPKVMEIGGGRFPSIAKETVDQLGIEYTSNDISPRELSLAPPWVKQACFDVSVKDQVNIEPYHDQYDLIFSKMVMEHVADYNTSYRNIFYLLKPSGISIAFHPVLYCPPFLLNRLIPDRLSRALLQAMSPNRSDDGIPKFPARYSGCVISNQIRNTLKEIGFRKVAQLPFYGHNYYDNIPILRQWNRYSTRQAMKHNRTVFASFAYTIVEK